MYARALKSSKVNTARLPRGHSEQLSSRREDDVNR